MMTLCIVITPNGGSLLQCIYLVLENKIRGQIEIFKNIEGAGL